MNDNAVCSRYNVSVVFFPLSSFTYIEYFALDASVNGCQLKNFIMQTVDIKTHTHSRTCSSSMTASFYFSKKIYTSIYALSIREPLSFVLLTSKSIGNDQLSSIFRIYFTSNQTITK